MISEILVPVDGIGRHVLEAGFDAPRKPCVMLLHGFPGVGVQMEKPLSAAGPFIGDDLLIAGDLRLVP